MRASSVGQIRERVDGLGVKLVLAAGEGGVEQIVNLSLVVFPDQVDEGEDTQTQPFLALMSADDEVAGFTDFSCGAGHDDDDGILVGGYEGVAALFVLGETEATEPEFIPIRVSAGGDRTGD
jgi:hypothetical protein